MPVPEPILESENPEEVERHSPQLYLRQQKMYQDALEKKDVEDPLLMFANVLAAQMLAEDPKLAPLKQEKQGGKIIYHEGTTLGNVTNLATNKVKKDPYFQMWAAGKSVDDLRQAAREPKKALEEVRELQKQEKHYSDLGKRGAEAKEAGRVSGAQQEAKSFYEAMQATGTGRNWLGVKRKSNSREYEAMMEAMGKAVNDGPKNQTPEQRAQNLAEAVAATKKYLADKKTVRKTEDGQTRWENAMQFLQTAMPAEEFKAYCDEVNAARGGKDRIIPEMFAPPRTAERTVEVVQQAVRDKGQITLQDAAKVAAAYDLSMSLDDGDGRMKVDPTKFQGRKIPLSDLEDRTRQYAETEAFQKWFKKQGKKVLKDDMTVGHDGLGARIGHWQLPRPQDEELTKQLEAREQEKIQQKEEEQRQKQAEEKKKRAFRTKLAKEDPETFQKIEDEFKEIKGLKGVDPEKYEKRKKEFNKKMDDLMEKDRKLQEDLYKLDHPDDSVLGGPKPPQERKSKVAGL